MDLLNELKKLITRLNEEKIEYALCGGLAMAVYALPRATLDIDILIESSSLGNTTRAVHELGFTLSAMPMQFHGGKIHIQRVSKIDFGTGETLGLDLLIVTPDIMQIGESRTKVEWEGGADWSAFDAFATKMRTVAATLPKSPEQFKKAFRL